MELSKSRYLSAAHANVSMVDSCPFFMELSMYLYSVCTVTSYLTFPSISKYEYQGKLVATKTLISRWKVKT